MYVRSYVLYKLKKIEKLFGGPRDSRVYALVRWLEPHPDSWERDD